MYDRVAGRIGEIAIPARPKGSAGEYNFPEDPTVMGIDEVGKWMFTLTAWNGYVLRNLAVADLVAAEARVNYEECQKKTYARIGRDKKHTRTTIELEALSMNPELITVKTTMDEAEAEVAFWERMHKIYEAQVAVLSREISRRYSEQQTEGRVPR